MKTAHICLFKYKNFILIKFFRQNFSISSMNSEYGFKLNLYNEIDNCKIHFASKKYKYLSSKKDEIFIELNEENNLYLSFDKENNQLKIQSFISQLEIIPSTENNSLILKLKNAQIGKQPICQI